MLRLLERLGTRERIVWQRDKLITLVAAPHVFALRKYRLPPPLHFAPGVLRAPVYSARDAASNLRVTWYAMGLDEAEVQRLDALDARGFLERQGVSARFIDVFWASVAMWIMNVPLERCSAGALMRFYREILGHNDYQVGFPGVGLSELYVPQARAAVAAAGGAVLTDAPVRAFIERAGRAAGVALADGRTIEARWCVAALPPQDLAPLLPAAWRAREPALGRLDELAPDPYISVYLWFDRRLTRERYWARLWAPENLGYDFFDLTNIRRGWEGRPSVIAANIMYSRRAAGLSDREIVAATVRELAELAPEAPRARLRHARVHRIPMAIVCPYPGTERKRPPARTAVPGLWLAGDWTGTGLPASMESAVRSGWLAAEEILARAGRPASLALALPEPEGLARLARWLRRHGTRGAAVRPEA